MKKGLLLSIVASTVVFAGGEIYPVEPAVDVPVAAAPVAATCGDFVGSFGAYYESKVKEDETDADGKSLDLFDKETAKFSMTAVIAMEKKLAYGTTVGVEMAGWRDSHEIADKGHRVSGADTHEGGELSQLWIAKSFGNTAIKLGRQALPVSLMPYAYTDTTAGVKDNTYEGVVFANTSLANTTIYGGWIGAITNAGTRTVIKDADGKDTTGLYALGFRTAAFGNLGVVGFHTDVEDSVWGDFSYKLGTWDAGVQGVWTQLDASGMDATTAAAFKVTKDFGRFDAKIVVSYIDAGDSGLGNAAVGNGAFWGDSYDNSDVEGDSSTGIGGTINIKNVLNGKVYLSAAHVSYDKSTKDTLNTATIGYKTTTKKGIALKAEFKHYMCDNVDGTDDTKDRVRLEAVYKF